MITELFQSNFRSGQHLGLQGPKMPKILIFLRLSNVSLNLDYLENYYSYSHRLLYNVIEKSVLQQIRKRHSKENTIPHLNIFV